MLAWLETSAWCCGDRNYVQTASPLIQARNFTNKKVNTNTPQPSTYMPNPNSSSQHDPAQDNGDSDGDLGQGSQHPSPLARHDELDDSPRATADDPTADGSATSSNGVSDVLSSFRKIVPLEPLNPPPGDINESGVGAFALNGLGDRRHFELS